jgi:hypothetical protein
MRNYLLIFLLSIGLCFGAAFTSSQNGNWDIGTTWGGGSGQVEGTDYPGAGDTASISHAVTGNITTLNATSITTTGTLGRLTCASATVDAINANIIMNGSGTDALRITGTDADFVITGNITNTGNGSDDSTISIEGACTVDIIGDVTGGTGSNNGGCHGVDITAAATVSITGDILGGDDDTGDCNGVNILAGTLTVAGGGTVTGGTVVANNYGINQLATNLLFITADVNGSESAGTDAPAINVAAAGDLTIVGNVAAGDAFGISQTAVQDIYINGNVTGKDNHGINTESECNLTVTGSVTGGWALAYHGIRMASSAGSLTVGNIVYEASKTIPLKVNLVAVPTITKFTIDGVQYDTRKNKAIGKGIL